MTPEQILEYPARVLSQTQRESYFEQGYLCVQSFAESEWLSELLRITAAFVDASRDETQSGDVFDIAPEHSPEKPKLRRLKMPDDRHQGYWDFVNGPLAEVAADLLGPDVVFHHSKLNFKWYDESDQVRWHQDAQFFPHTNYNVLTIGTYLADTDMNNGPLAVIPASHAQELYDQYDANGQWVGHLSDADAGRLPLETARYLTGPAGSITIHSCRMVHGSPSSKLDAPRPLLLNCFTSADARPYTPNPQESSHTGTLVRGQPARWAHHDPRPCLIPPDWSGGYTSIYAAQAGEDK